MEKILKTDVKSIRTTLSLADVNNCVVHLCLEKVEYIRAGDGGRYLVFLVSGAQLEVTKDVFEEILEKIS